MKHSTPTPEPTTATTGENIKRLFTFRFPSVYGHGPEKMPAGAQGALNALRLYFAYRHNGFLLMEAVELCTRHKANPPAWVMEGLNEGFARFRKGRVSLERALRMTKGDRQEYEQYRAEGDVMREVRRTITADPRRRIAPACVSVAARRRINPETVEKAYRRFWRGFFDYIKGE